MAEYSNIVSSTLSERFSPAKSKRHIKILGGKKKEEPQFPEMSSSVSEETSALHEKPLQTTNQVKANLINANMIKGDMILTKPGQGRTNQKVTFVQKQVLMKPNELKSIGLKKSMMVPKGKLMNQANAKLFATKDGKLVQLPVGSKTVNPNTQVTQMKMQVQTQQQSASQPIQSTNQGLLAQQQSKTAMSTANNTPLKVKAGDIKKEKRKSDASIESLSKGEENPAKSMESKALDSQYILLIMLSILRRKSVITSNCCTCQNKIIINAKMCHRCEETSEEGEPKASGICSGYSGSSTLFDTGYNSAR